MKKDENKSSIEQIKAGESLTSSPVTVLKKLREEEEKEEAAAKAMELRCPTCSKEIKRCICPKGKSAPGEENGSTDSKEAANQSDASEAENVLVVEKKMGEESLSEVYSSRKGMAPEFNPKAITKLNEQEDLADSAVDNDRESKTLTIKLVPGLSEEQKEELIEFIKAVLKEAQAFKKEHNLPDECIKVMRDETTGMIEFLQIKMQDLVSYDKFIDQLRANLAPTLKPTPAEKDEFKEEQKFNPSPFKMEPW